MGKQVKGWTPPDDDLIVEETVEQKPTAWTPPDDDVVVDPVKKKELTSPSSSASPAPGKPSKTSSEKSTSTGRKYKEGELTLGNVFRDLVKAYNTPADKSLPPEPTPLVNAIKRGANLAEQAGILGPTEGKPTNEKLKKVAKLQTESRALASSEEYKKFTGAETFTDAALSFAKSPVKILAELTAESMTSMISYGASRIATGAAQGAVLGSVVPGVGTIAGAGAGSIVGLADTSLGLEFSGSFLESLEKAGVDTTDPQALEIAFQDDAVISEARSHAFKKGIPIALFDLISGGIAGKIVSKPAKSLIGKVGQGAMELAAQSLMGAGGELAGQVVSGEDIQPGAILAEAVGEVATAPVEVAVGAATFNKAPSQVVAEQTAEIIPTDVPSLDTKAEIIQDKVEKMEAAVTSGQSDVQPTIPNDQAPQTPPATVDEEPGATVPEVKEEEKTEVQADTQVAQEVIPPTQESSIPQTLYIPEQETGSYSFERPKTQQADAVQEQSTEKISVGETPGDSQAVGEGNTTRQVAQESVSEEEVQDESADQQVVNQPSTLYENGDNIRAGASDVPNANQAINERIVSADTGVVQPVVEQQAQPVLPGSAKESAQGSEAPPGVPPDQAAQAEPLEVTPEERKTFTRIKNDPDISDTIKQGITAEAKKYIPRSLKKVTEKEATAIIDAKGLDESIKMYMDDTSGIHPDVDTAIGIKLFDRLQTENNFDDAIRVFEKLSVRGTELGQAVNAYKLMQGKTMINVVQKSITKARKNYKAKNEWRGQDAKRAIDKINTAAVDVVLKSPKVQNKIRSEVKKGSVKKAIDFLETLKVDTKGKALDVVYGISAAAWNTVITAVQKGLQAGLTVSQAINKAVNSVKEPGFKRSEALTYLDDKLKDYRVTLDPGRAIKEELASSGQKIDDIVRQHYSQVASTKSSLIDKLIKDGKVAADQAQAIADELGAEFDRLTRAAKDKALRKLLPKPSKNVTKKEQKDTVDDLIAQSNIGALSEEQYSDAITDKLGVPKLSEQQLREITGLTDKVQKAKGETAKSKAAQDLMNYVENLKGWNWVDAVGAIWYANILSGPSTWLVTNPFANLTNLLAEAAIDVAQHPTKAPFILAQIARGLNRGMAAAGDVLKTGYNPYKGEDYKTESKPLLERIEFKGGKINPLNWLKYVTRAIKAGDILFFHGLKEQRIAVLALREARKNGRTQPSHDDMHSLRQQLMKENYDNASQQAESEGFKGREQKIRAYEILEATRPEWAIQESQNFAARGTFNIKPEGYLGRVAQSLNNMRREIPPLNAVMPFVNTIINVANEYLNYVPILGHYRAFKGTADHNPEKSTYRKYTNEERARIALKATTGLLAMTAIALLDDPDDKDSKFEITANGTGDMKKNYELERQGWRPYSFRVGDTWISYKNTPWAMPLASVGFFKDTQRYIKDPTPSESLWIVAAGSFGFLMDLSALSGLTDFAKMLTTETLAEQGSFGEKVGKWVEKTAKSVVIPNYFTQISRLIQELTETPIKRADHIGATFIRDIPVLRDHLGNMYDSFGDPVIPKQLEKLIPLNVHRSPEDKELFDFLQEKKLFIGVPSPSNLKPNGTPMTTQEYRTWSVAAAKATKKRLLREYKIYMRQKNKEVINEWFNEVKTEERRNAKVNIFGYF